MKMMEELTLVDPLTFEIKKVPYRDSWKQYTYRFLNEAVQEIRGELKGKDDVGKLKIICDYLVEELPRSYWSEIPAQNSFPGFFSSLADHAIATSTIGVALAVECRLEGIDFAKEYKGKELESLLNDAAGLIQVVRLACLLHDAGKPLQDHELKTREVVEKFLSDMGFGALSKELAELASKHHYGAGSEHPPTTMLEWVIAYADKVAVQDRSTISPDPKGLAEALRKLHLDTKDKRILEVAETLEAESPLKPEKLSQTMRLLLPVDEEYRKTLDRELLNAPGRLKIDEKPLAVLLLEAQGIQDIVRRSEALKGLMGYSAMVELGMEEAADVIRNRLAPESIVFIGGGSLLAIVPSGLFEEIKKEASRKYSEFVKGAGVLKAPFDREPVSFSLYELKNGPGFAWSAFVSYPGELSPRSFGQVFNIAMQTLEPCEAVDPVGGELRLKPSGLCTVCRMEEGLSTSPDGERLGQVCKQAYDVRNRIMEILQKPVPMGEGPAGGRLRGGDPKLNKLPIVSVTWRSIEKLSERIRENAALSEALKGKTLTYNLVSTIDHLGRQMERALKASQGGGVETTREVEEVYDIAVIKGDGDNFGMIKSSMVNLTGYRHVSNLFKEVIEEGLAEALSAVMLRQIELSLKGDGDNFSFEYPFLIIYAGGDDFLLLLDAPASLIFLESFNRYLERRFKASRNDYALGCSTQFLGVSLGLAVMRNRMPIYAALEAVEELEDKAKKDGKTRTEKFGSRIHVALHRFTGLPSKYEVRKVYEEGIFPGEGSGLKIIPTAWPRTSKELFGPGGFVETIEYLLKGGVKSNRLKQMLLGGLNRLPGEIDLMLRYKAARDKEQEKGVKPYMKLADKAYIPLKVQGVDAVKYAFPDIIEAMMIIRDEGKLLPRWNE